jgi:hypothetical protein
VKADEPEGAADWYRDVSRHGGILSEFPRNWFQARPLKVQHGLGSRGGSTRSQANLRAGRLSSVRKSSPPIGAEPGGVIEVDQVAAATEDWSSDAAPALLVEVRKSVGSNRLSARQ